jgi:hypothetical protein
MVTGKRFLFFAGVVVVVLATAGMLSAITAEYNRPNPAMDYVPQETGIYDTGYWKLGELDCRECHGDTLADRHHMSEMVLVYGLCTPCHELDPGEPGGVVVTRDCTTSGCHHWNDVLTQPNGWHHDTDLSGSDNCTTCHDPALIGEITNFRDMTMYPPTQVTPMPFSCENCHWKQAVVSLGWQPGDADPSPANAGHPSDYNHYDIWGNGPDYWEYGKKILHNYETHHMGAKGNVQAPCWKCHGIDPNEENYDETDPNLIRYCEICHDMYSLHTIPGHISDTMGWEAVGLHTSSPSDSEPTVYREFTVWDEGVDGPPSAPTETDEICLACHGDNLTEPAPTPDPCVHPSMTSVEPKYFTCNVTVTIRGTNFGEETYPNSKVELEPTLSPGTWYEMTIVSWTDTQVEFFVPCHVLSSGVYKVRLTNGCDLKHKWCKVTYGGWISVASLDDYAGACGYNRWITVNGGNFGTAQTETWTDSVSGLDYGVHRTIELVSSQYPYTGPLVAQNYQNWSNTSIQFGMYGTTGTSFFVDDYMDGVWFDDGEPRRNHIKDASECELMKCNGLTLGPYNVYAVATYFADLDTSGTLNAGDIITQVVTSDPAGSSPPEIYELTNVPYINALNPKGSIQPGATARLRLYGWGFGPTQGDGEVRIGRLAHYNAFPTLKGKSMAVKGWSNTRIKIKVGAGKFPDAWKDTWKYVWVIKDGEISNAKRIKLLAW